MLIHLLLFLLCLNTGKGMKRNHQQVINETPSPQGILDNDILTRAIDRTLYKEDDERKVGYIFTATFCPKLLPQHKPCNHTLLVKLHENLPNDKPFKIMWAKRYQEPNISNEIQGVMDVYDVKDTGGGYILCGRYGMHDRIDDPDTFAKYGAFMLLTDEDGKAKKFMIYPEIHVLYSVVDFGKFSLTKRNGFFAVGRSIEKEGLFKAVMLRTKYDLNPICQKNVAGVSTISTADKVNLESTFRRVIRKGSNNFVMIGHTNGGGEICMKDSDVLFAVADRKCKIKKVKNNLMLRQYKMKDSNEYGLSIADTGRTLIITGNIQRLTTKEKCKVVGDDILLMTLNKKGLVAAAARVDIDSGPDTGTSILFRKKTKSILVAGETQTSLLTDVALSPTSKDIFLLETDMKMKKAKKLEVFGKAMDEEREVDVVLSQDDNAVILGNTKSFTSAQSTYLIERYNQVDERCYYEKVDVELIPIKFEVLKPTYERIQTPKVERKLETEDVDLNQTIICKKEP